MRLAATTTADGARRWGRIHENRFHALPPSWTLDSLLALPSQELRQTLEETSTEPLGRYRLTAPVDRATEIWAAGVTYEISRAARTHESGSPDVYLQVYDAERPELFFKAVGWRVVGPEQPIGVRADSTWNVPEPELAVVANSEAEIVGYTICNDVSSRSIEGENPLYLPQAKIYRGSCALGPWIRPAWEIDDPYDLDISITIERDGTTLWQDQTSTARLHRTLEELIDFLFAGDEYPHGVILATGTCLVPDENINLEKDDEVRITITDVGELRNPVLSGKEAFASLSRQAEAMSPHPS